MDDHLTAKVSAALHCIDLSNPDIHQSAALVKQACMNSGIFYVINHGISEELLHEVFAQSKKFFELPMNEKMNFFWNQKQRGYHPPVQMIIDHMTNQKDQRETYHIGVEVADDDPDAKLPYYGQNFWPLTDILPGWEATMLQYHREAIHVGRTIARIIALALDVSFDFFDQFEMLGKPIANLDVLHYGVEVTDPLKELLGTPVHTDYGLITLLATDDSLGLQICRDKNANPPIWEYVQPLKGAFIVNIGETLERFSNCLFRSTLHRVVFRKERYSIALFLFPSHNGVVECLPSCMSEQNPPKYPPIKCGEFLSLRFNQAATSRIKYITEAGF